MTTITLTHEEMQKALNLVAFAMSKDITRYYLNGVLFEIDEAGTLRLVATDGHRLACYKPQGAGINPLANRLSCIVPRETITAWLKDKPARGAGDNPVALTFTDTNVTRSTATVISTSPLIDGNFPDWRRVVPDHSKVERLAPAQFNALYMADVAKALKDATGRKALKDATGRKASALRVITGEGMHDAMLLTSEIEGWYSVLMPVTSNQFADATL